MGPLGPEELVAIFILALLLFGPKELPKLGKTIGKAMSEFRRAQAELKTTFDRHMKDLERETGIRELAETTFQSSYDYDHSNYDPSHYEDPYADGTWDPATKIVTYDASAPQGVESKAEPLQIEAAHGTIPNGHLEAEHAPVASLPAPAEHGQSEPNGVGHAEQKTA